MAKLHQKYPSQVNVVMSGREDLQNVDEEIEAFVGESWREEKDASTGWISHMSDLSGSYSWNVDNLDVADKWWNRGCLDYYYLQSTSIIELSFNSMRLLFLGWSFCI